MLYNIITYSKGFYVGIETVSFLLVEEVIEELQNNGFIIEAVVDDNGQIRAL